PLAGSTVGGRGVILAAVDPDGLHVRHGQAELLKVGFDVGGPISAAELYDPDALTGAVQAGREIVKLRQLGRSEGDSHGMRLHTGRRLLSLEVRLRRGAIVDPEDPFDDI